MTAETTMKIPGMPGGFLPWWVVLLEGIIALILGIFFLTSPYMTLLVLVTFLGAYWFVSGIDHKNTMWIEQSHPCMVAISAIHIFAGLETTQLKHLHANPSEHT